MFAPAAIMRWIATSWASTARRVCDHRHVPALAERLDRRHGDANLGPKAGHDQLLATRRLDDIDDLGILPGVDKRSVDHLLIRENVRDLRKDKAAALGENARQDGRNPERLRNLRQPHRIVDGHLRVVAVEVRELIRLVIDQHEDAVFRTQQSIESGIGHGKFLLVIAE
jgi:hypothetical protein